MKISAVNSAMCFCNRASFKGFMGPSHTKAISMPKWSQAAHAACGTYHIATTLTYYRFSDDNDKDINRVVSENSYFRTTGMNSDPRSCNQFDTIEEGNVKVKAVPLTAKEYYGYINGDIQGSEKDEIKSKLKKAKLRELIRR